MDLGTLQGTSRSDYDIEVLSGKEQEYIEMVCASVFQLQNILSRMIG